MARLKLWLGTHEVSWLGRTAVPLFISRRRLARQKSWPRALGSWALDSGGFTELSRGGWSIAPAAYVAEVRRWRDEIGGLEWCAPMDWMCEPSMIRATGRSVVEHQRLTLANFETLRGQLGGLVVPVLQGWEIGDYLSHVDQYARAGFDLRREPLVGVGSVCRRGRDAEIVAILSELAGCGLALHAFGVRSQALQMIGAAVASADSMAWSARARRAHRHGEPRPAACRHPGSCSNCMTFALQWRAEQLARPALPARHWQIPLIAKEAP